MRTNILFAIILLTSASLHAGTPEIQAKTKELEAKLAELEKDGKKKAKKLEGGMATLKGIAINETITWLASKYSSLPNNKRGELNGIIKKWVDASYEQAKAGGRFTVECHGTKWTPLDKSGKIKEADYLGASIDEFKEEVLIKYLCSGRYITHSHLKAGGSRCPTKKKADEEGKYSSHQNKGAGTALFFYLRSKKAKSIKLKISDTKKGNKIKMLLVNGESLKAKAKKSIKVELMEGVNGFALLLENTKGGAITYSIDVDGKDLEVGTVGR